MENNSRRTSDGRFKKSESKIQQAIVRGQIMSTTAEKISVSKFCKLAQISRATFYRHYADIGAAMQTFMQKAEHEVKQPARSPHGGEVEVGIYLILGYLQQNREFYGKTIEAWNYQYLLGILTKMKDLIFQRWREIKPDLPETHFERLFLIFSFGFFQELTFWWREENFCKETETTHVRRLNRLAEQLPRRRYDAILPPLGSF